MGSQQSIFSAVATLVIGSANEYELKKIFDEERLKELKKPPSLDEAKNLRAKYSVADLEADNKNPKAYNIWSASPEKLGKYGVGLELYFLFLKQMAILFFIIACISIYPAYTNSKGTWIEDDESQSGSRFTLANPYWLKKSDRCIFDLCRGNITDERINEIQDDIDENYKETWIVDAAYTCIFLIGLVIILIVNKIKINHNTLGNDRVADYSIEVGGFPDKSIDIFEVLDHFKCFGNIVEIYLGRSYGDLLYFYREKAEVSKKIKIHQIFLDNDLESVNNEKLKKLQIKLLKLEKNIKNSSFNKLNHELPVNRAYIIFESQEGRARAITKYRKKWCFLKNNDSSLKFQGEHKLKVYSSTEPSDIIWENLQIAYWERVSRITSSVIIVVILMSISVGLIFLMKRGSQNTYDAYRCMYDHHDDDYPLNHVLANETSWDSDGAQMQCWCSQQPASDWAQKPQIRSICMDYVMQKLSSAAVNFFICCGIVIINYTLRQLFTILSEFERRKSYNIKQTHLMLKIFAAMLTNTALVPIIVHLSYNNDGQDELIDRQFNDITKYWYVKVGSMFYIMMCINVVSPHLIFNFLVMYMTGLWKRFRSSQTYKTQYEIYNAFIGPEFRLATRTSMILTVIFTCFIFSGGIPLLNIIAFLALFVIYWTDKFLILRHYRKPPYYSHHVYSSAIKVMPLCAFFHSCFSLYAYGCDDVFPQKLRILANTMLGESYYYADLNYQSLKERITMDHGIMFFILIIISLVLFLLFIFSEKLTKECKRILLLRGYKETKKFSSAKNNIKKYALTSYDLEQNPNYSFLINEMNKDVKDGKFGWRRTKTANKLTVVNERRIITSSWSDELQYLNQDEDRRRANNEPQIRLSTSLPNIGSEYVEHSSLHQSKAKSTDLNSCDIFYWDEKNATRSTPEGRTPEVVYNEEGSQSILVGISNGSYSG
ncbi:unnamed protein product [Blepharisma stoltei]|uniref:CSC1/OSCA1-like cytosolic domain-containing protein n=1 Tax=Blepharisma stoltei TaxID=1481888 RepID=A0AAU9J882_9CILI|nr:unnamed protein product [Blepharisma stoltei]